jgi:hypothetical protein
MTKSQKNLIGLLLSFLQFAIIVFREELLSFPNRLIINAFMQDYFSVWGISLYTWLFLAKTFKMKWKILSQSFYFGNWPIWRFSIWGLYSLQKVPKGRAILAILKVWLWQTDCWLNVMPNVQGYDLNLFYTLKH